VIFCHAVAPGLSLFFLTKHCLHQFAPVFMKSKTYSTEGVENDAAARPPNVARLVKVKVVKIKVRTLNIAPLT